MKKQKKQLIIMVVFLGFLIVAYFALGAYNDAQANKDEDEKETIVVTDLDVDEVVAFSYNYEEENNSFTKSEEVWNYDADAAFDVDESLIEDMISDACSITAQEYFDSYESLDNYGLDTPQQTVSMTFSDGSEVKLLLGDYNDIIGYYYLMVEGDDKLYLVNSTLANAIDVSYADLEYVVEETETEEVSEEVTE